jgi:RNA recognition motif-containing protein
MTKRLFVGGLPYSLTEDDLKKLFSDIGEVVACDLIIDRYTNASKGFAFIEMKTDEDTQKAIDELNGKEIDGRKIAVNIAKPREERSDRNFNSDRRGGFNRGGGSNFNRKSY